jgi:MinD superfamily P-loop ATPase
MKINQGKCVRCGKCVSECPMWAIKWLEDGTLTITADCVSCFCPAADVCSCKAIEETKQ